MTRDPIGLLALVRRWLHRATMATMATRGALLHALMLASVLCLAVVR
jgi:hypothetical protein